MKWLKGVNLILTFIGNTVYHLVRYIKNSKCSYYMPWNVFTIVRAELYTCTPISSQWRKDHSGPRRGKTGSRPESGK